MNQIQKIEIEKVFFNDENPRFIKDEKFDQLKKSIVEFPEMLEKRPIVINKKNIALGGNMRLKACIELGLTHVYVLSVDWTPEQERQFIIKDNVGFGEWDIEDLNINWDVEQLEDWGLDLDFDTDLEGVESEKEDHRKLTDIFLIPPFSILDTRQGYWTDRKKYWQSIINNKGESREGTLLVYINVNG